MAKIDLSQIITIAKSYIQELEKLGVQPATIILYGSYAKGSAGPASDIDLIVISDDLAKWPPLERLQMLSRATMHIDAPLEVLGYTPEEIRKNGDRSIFWEEITKTGKEIYKRAA